MQTHNKNASGLHSVVSRSDLMDVIENMFKNVMTIVATFQCIYSFALERGIAGFSGHTLDRIGLR
jgi:hypothetical protein